jgi:hypothetical protein
MLTPNSSLIRSGSGHVKESIVGLVSILFFDLKFNSPLPPDILSTYTRPLHHMLLLNVPDTSVTLSMLA